jgi:hypothetical protein
LSSCFLFDPLCGCAEYGTAAYSVKAPGTVESLCADSFSAIYGFLADTVHCSCFIT